MFHLERILSMQGMYMYGQLESSAVLGLLAAAEGAGEHPIYRGIASPSSLNFLS